MLEAPRCEIRAAIERAILGWPKGRDWKKGFREAATRLIRTFAEAMGIMRCGNATDLKALEATGSKEGFPRAKNKHPTRDEREQ